MPSNPPEKRTHHHHVRKRPILKDNERIRLNTMLPSADRHRAIRTPILSLEQEPEPVNESPLLKIIVTKRRKDWAKVVAPVDVDKIKKQTESISTKFKKLFSKIPSPCRSLLHFIERRNGYTIRSYFQFIIWLFYLNIFTFLLTFTCIIMPTYIYPNPPSFSTYAMNEYYQINNIDRNNETTDECTLTDPRCKILELPLSERRNESNDTCLSDSFTASSCCSLHTEAFFISSTHENDWKGFLTDLIDGTGFLARNRLFIGYYRNLTKSNDQTSILEMYNMGFAVFVTTFFCLLITGIIILRKFGDGMRRSYVQSESFENNLFQYIFARWNYRSTDASVSRRHKHRFNIEITNILFERKDKIKLKSNGTKDRIVFQLKRMCIWLLTIIIFIGAITALFFTNRFAFQKRAEKELNSGSSESGRFEDLIVEYLPSIVVSVINLTSQLVFAYMRDYKLYTRTTAVRHYLIKVIIMRLLLLFIFFFIIILQITCNSNQCGIQSELIDCAEIKGRSTFTHCWETLIGQVIYRLVITDTAVMILVHLVVDPLRSLLRRCCSSSTAETTSVFLQPLQFEVGDYVLDLTYSQTLCWHGILFCPYLPLIAAVKNILIFAVKSLSLALFRKRSGLELSPARARFIFTGVLLFSFIWALLPIAFLTTSLRTSRGCGPFRLYSHEPDFYMYFSVRNVLSQIRNQIIVNILIKMTSAVVIVPLVLMLILYSCILMIRRNSYRGASLELYKLLYSSHKTHQLALQNLPATSSRL